jgi:hypothetical protein
VGLAASVLLAAITLSCGEEISGPTTVATGDLLILAMQATAPTVPPSSFFAYNSRLTTERLLHSDPANTLFMQLNVPARVLSSLNGVPLTLQDSVLLTIQPTAGIYGFTLSPSGLAFTLGEVPTARVSFAVYGDFTVVDDSPSYESAGQYAAALQFWFEVTPGRWRPVTSSRLSGTDAVEGPIDEPGIYIVAAPR